MQLTIIISPMRVFRLLCIAIALLVTASTIAAAALYYYRWPMNSPQIMVVRLFWLDTEANLPTLFQSLMLLASSCLLMIVGSFTRLSGNGYATHWKFMAFVFLYLAIDESAHIHETISELMTLMHSTIFDTLGWLIVGIPGVLIFAIAYIPFLLHLPARTRWLFLLSGAVFIGSVIGLELIGQHYAMTHGKDNMFYGSLATAEECMEMIAIAIFIYTLLDYLQNHMTKLRVGFESI